MATSRTNAGKTRMKKQDKAKLPFQFRFLTWLMFGIVIVLILMVIAFFARGGHVGFLAHNVPELVNERSSEEAFYFGASDYSGSSKYSRPQRSNGIVPANPLARKVVKSTYLSILVQDTNQTVSKISSLVDSYHGFIIDQNVETETDEYIYTNARISVRIPVNHLNDFVDKVKSYAKLVKIERVEGEDITEAYEDINAKINLYEDTYTKIEELMSKTDDVDKLMKLQDKLLYLRRQIDNLIGRRRAMDEMTRYAKVTIYITDDKYSLSFVPKNIWDISTTVKLATSSLIRTLVLILKALIWIGVYSVIWAPVAYFIMRRKK